MLLINKTINKLGLANKYFLFSISPLFLIVGNNIDKVHSRLLNMFMGLKKAGDELDLSSINNEMDTTINYSLLLVHTLDILKCQLSLML